MIQWGLPAIIDWYLRRHGLHQGLIWGWIATIWLAHILTTSDHRKRPVQAWAKQAQETIGEITVQEVSELDFTDDRLTTLLELLSYQASWESIEREMGQNIMSMYELKPEIVRLDATTISGYHAGGYETKFRREPVPVWIQQGRSKLETGEDDVRVFGSSGVADCHASARRGAGGR